MFLSKTVTSISSLGLYRVGSCAMFKSSTTTSTNVSTFPKSNGSGNSLDTLSTDNDVINSLQTLVASVICVDNFSLVLN